jgi:hypothetical protein
MLDNLLDQANSMFSAVSTTLEVAYRGFETSVKSAGISAGATAIADMGASLKDVVSNAPDLGAGKGAALNA